MKNEKPQVMTQPGVCAKCGNSLRPGAQFCPACGSKVLVEPANNSPKKIWKVLKTLGIIAAVVAVLVIIGSVVLSALGLTGPGTKTVFAAAKSVSAGSFSVEAEGSIGSADLEMHLDAELDLKERMFAYLGSVTADCGRETYDFQMGCLNDESALVESQYNAVEYVLDYCSEEFSEEEMEHLGLLLEDVFDGLDTEIVEERLLRCAVTTVKLLNNKSWLKEHANYRTSREKGVKVLCYDVELFEFAAAIMENFAPAFRDPDELEAMCDALRDAGDEMDDCQAQLRVGIRRGYIDHIALEIEADFLPEIQLRFNFSQYGDCEVSAKQVRKLLEMA